MALLMASLGWRAAESYLRCPRCVTGSLGNVGCLGVSQDVLTGTCYASSLHGQEGRQPSWWWLHDRDALQLSGVCGTRRVAQ